jgi:hypothetical protein
LTRRSTPDGNAARTAPISHEVAAKIAIRFSGAVPDGGGEEEMTGGRELAAVNVQTSKTHPLGLGNAARLPAFSHGSGDCDTWQGPTAGNTDNTNGIGDKTRQETLSLYDKLPPTIHLSFDDEGETALHARH